MCLRGRGPYIILESIRFSAYSPPFCRAVECTHGPLVGSLPAILTTGSLRVAHVFYKANSNVCHTAAILDAAHGNVQQPAHNLVAV